MAKTKIQMEGVLFSIKIKSINEDSFYSVKRIEDIKEKEIINKNFISLKNLKINLSNDIEIVEDYLYNVEEKDFIETKDNLFSEKLLNKFEEEELEGIAIEIKKYKFTTPSIKISDKELNKSKIKIETTDFEALTDSIIDEEIIKSIYYNDKEINLYKQGFFIFSEKMKKELKETLFLTYNLEDYNPCLEKKIKS